jgi:hypothetical protein
MHLSSEESDSQTKVLKDANADGVAKHNIPGLSHTDARSICIDLSHAAAMPARNCNGTVMLHAQDV